LPNKTAATVRLTAHATIETEQARHTREAADAIFNPQPITAVVEDQNRRSDVSAATKQRPARVARVLTASPPQPDPASDPLAEIPASKYGRIRALATHGMTIAQVAEAYAVAESEIERIVGKPTPDHRSR
jgi:hypothetical protein